MQLFSEWSERQAHLTRWVLLLGWLLLITTLLVPGLDPWPFENNHCGPMMPSCHSHEGNQLFWGMVVPGGLLILVAASHELWRRICPLAFLSQLFRALGWQRTVAGKGGRREVVRVHGDSWLGKHHVQLQWSLFIAGLCLRLLVVNSSTLGLGLFLLVTIAAALVVGWAYGGKAWCQYVCPMAPVQVVLTGPRSFFGSPAHLGTGSRITQSMCRSVGEQGKEQSACVACQAPCLDIDSERAYWQTLSGKRGLTWAWWSYPGLVIGFFLLIKYESRGSLDYLRSGMWAYDSETVAYAWKPLGDGLWTLGLPRLVTEPALLVLSGWVSVGLFSWLQRVQRQALTAELGERALDVSISRTRLLSTFVAVNGFFWFADSTIGLLGPAGGQVIRSLALIVSGMWLHRCWHRDRATYTRESTSTSLRRQLQKQIPDLTPYLDGRSLQELSPGEVFTLAKVLPTQISQTKQTIYKEVMVDLFSTGRLERAAAFVYLEELRASLGLEEEDHHGAIRELAIADPRILQLTHLQTEKRTLRQEAASEAIEAFLQTSGRVDLNGALRQPGGRERLERICSTFGLDEDGWSETLSRFCPSSPYARQRLVSELERLRHQLASRLSLERAAVAEPLLRPLLQTMDRRITSHAVTLLPALQAFGPEEPLRRQMASLEACFTDAVRAQVRRREHDHAHEALDRPVAPAALDPLPDPAAVLDELWQDPDPDTALWALWVQCHWSPARAQALRLHSRIGLPGSPALDRFLAGEGMKGEAPPA